VPLDHELPGDFVDQAVQRCRIDALHNYGDVFSLLGRIAAACALSRRQA